MAWENPASSDATVVVQIESSDDPSVKRLRADIPVHADLHRSGVGVAWRQSLLTRQLHR